MFGLLSGVSQLAAVHQDPMRPIVVYDQREFCEED
jgi:hypothetical protein